MGLPWAWLGPVFVPVFHLETVCKVKQNKRHEQDKKRLQIYFVFHIVITNEICIYYKVSKKIAKKVKKNLVVRFFIVSLHQKQTTKATWNS